MNPPKKIAIIGGSSALATYLTPVLRHHYNVVTLGRHDCDMFLDVTQNIQDFQIPHPVDVVVHMAASFVGQTDSDILHTFDVNVLGALKSSMAAHAAGATHFVYVSSIYTQLPKDHPYASAYAASKRAAEEAVSMYCVSRGMKLTILRLAPIYDAVGLFRSHQAMVYRMADNAEHNRDIALYGSHDAVRNYIFAGDVAEIIAGVIRQDCVGIFSCLNPHNITISAMAQAALDAFSSTARFHFLPDKENIPDTIFPTDNALYDVISYTPKVDIAEGMKKIAQARRSATS